MGFFLLKRFFTLVATLLGASVVVFVVLDILPGNAKMLRLARNGLPNVKAERNSDSVHVTMLF